MMTEALWNGYIGNYKEPVEAHFIGFLLLGIKLFSQRGKYYGPSSALMYMCQYRVILLILSELLQIYTGVHEAKIQSCMAIAYKLFLLVPENGNFHFQRRQPNQHTQRSTSWSYYIHQVRGIAQLCSLVPLFIKGEVTALAQLLPPPCQGSNAGWSSEVAGSAAHSSSGYATSGENTHFTALWPTMQVAGTGEVESNLHALYPST